MDGHEGTECRASHNLRAVGSGIAVPPEPERVDSAAPPTPCRAGSRSSSAGSRCTQPALRKPAQLRPPLRRSETADRNPIPTQGGGVSPWPTCALVCTHKTLAKGRSICSRSTENLLPFHNRLAYNRAHMRSASPLTAAAAASAGNSRVHLNLSSASFSLPALRSTLLLLPSLSWLLPLCRLPPCHLSRRTHLFDNHAAGNVAAGNDRRVCTSVVLVRRAGRWRRRRRGGGRTVVHEGARIGGRPLALFLHQSASDRPRRWR